MDTEELAPTEGETGAVVAPEEDAAPPPPLTVEDFARERGWRPKEEFQGDESEWRDAAGFLAYGLDRSSDLRREVKELRGTVDRFGNVLERTTSAAAERARVEERQEWEQRHARAVEEGDLTTATEAVQKIAELQRTPTTPSVKPVEITRFEQENTWLGKDEDATALAVAVTNREAAKGRSVDEQLAAARDAVHKRFPEYAPNQAKPAPSVAQPARTIAPAKRGKTFSDLPAAAQQAWQIGAKKHGVSKEDYAKYYYEGAA